MDAVEEMLKAINAHSEKCWRAKVAREEAKRMQARKRKEFYEDILCGVMALLFVLCTPIMAAILQ